MVWCLVDFRGKGKERKGKERKGKEKKRRGKKRKGKKRKRKSAIKTFLSLSSFHILTIYCLGFGVGGVSNGEGVNECFQG